MKSGKTVILAGLCVVCGGLMASLAGAQQSDEINVAPPNPVIEVVPALQPGSVWAPGYYEWNGSQHIWVPGRVMDGQAGSHWVPDSWDHRHLLWHHDRGHWEPNS